MAEMLKNDIIRSSQSPYSSLVLLVSKADGNCPMCVDYRSLNKDTAKHNYPIPNIDELLDELYGVVIFLKLDLLLEYHQIRMNSENIHNTVFRAMRIIVLSDALWAHQHSIHFPRVNE